jgi:hypothetical protein
MTAFLAAQPAPMTPQQYQQELTAWMARLDSLRTHPDQAAEMERQVPKEWPVQQSGRTLRVSSDWLQVGMARIVDDHAHRKADITRLHNALAAHLMLLDETNAIPDSGAARAQMQRILAGREFRGVHPPGAVENTRNHIWAWITSHLRRALRGATSHPTVWQWAVWGVMLLVMATALRYVWNFAQRRGRPANAPELPADRPSATPWQRWVEQARAAAGAGGFRDAVHCTYWAAISWLEAQGAWMPDRARTPREYLRLMKRQTPQRRILLALTQRFEPVWYGGHAATSDDFNAMLRELEELGCR